MEKSERYKLIEEIQTIKTIFSHRTIRRFKGEESLSKLHKEIIEMAAQRAATSCSGQMYSFIEVDDQEARMRLYNVCGKQRMIKEAGLFYVVVADLYRLDALVRKAGGNCKLGPISGSLIAACDASFAAQNLVLAAEALGYGTAYIGSCGDRCEEVAEILKIPNRVIPLYGLAIGTPAEDPPKRPRISKKFIFHKNIYKKLTDYQLQETIDSMSRTLSKEGYYQKYGRGKDYTWKDHLYQKFGGTWLKDVELNRKEAVDSKMLI